MWTTETLILADQDKQILQQLAKAPTTPQGIAQRCRIILSSNAGMANSAIARTLSISRPTILLWKNRFKVKGVTGLMEIEEGRGKKPVVSTKKIEAIIEDTLHTKPADADVWTTRTLAHKHGVSHDFVKKVWQANNLKPWW